MSGAVGTEPHTDFAALEAGGVGNSLAAVAERAVADLAVMGGKQLLFMVREQKTVRTDKCGPKTFRESRYSTGRQASCCRK